MGSSRPVKKEFTEFIVKTNGLATRYATKLCAIKRLHVSYGEDARNTSYLIMLDKWSDIRRHPALTGYLLTTIRNVTNELQRSLTRTVSLEEEMAVAILDGASAEDQFILRDETRRTLEALRTFNPEWQDVILLSMDGLSGPQIAALTGDSAAAVRKRLSRARHELKEVVAADRRDMSGNGP